MEHWLPLVLLTVTVFVVAVLAMVGGTLLSGRCLRGSCGGPEALGPDGEPLSCATCPNRKRREGSSAADGQK